MGGEYRSFSHCITTWENQVMHDLTIDLFLSTWNQSFAFSERMSEMPKFKHLENKKFNVFQEDIKKQTSLPIKYLNVENQISFEHRGNNQIYHWHNLIVNLINLKNDYDFAFITRPDVEISFQVKLYESIKNVSKYILYGMKPIEINEPSKHFVVNVSDIYFLASPNLLIDVFFYLPYMKTESLDMTLTGKGTNFHNHLAYYFIKNNVHLLEFEYGHILDSSAKMRLRCKQ